ncbi:MAG TPA: hypothetical protein VJ732_16620, partial [Bryobacteraceae bacterium]|nr:hypothetical protein [Bryobacteraceae bacterium]
MNSLFAKILLWFWCTVAIAVVGSAFISALKMDENDTDRRAPASRRLEFQLSEARAVYEMGGQRALQKFTGNLRRVYGAQGILTDRQGRDLLTGQDRSDLIRRAQHRRPFQLFPAGGDTLARAADDGR